MKPHDALYHYGVMGMRWGVRKDAYERIGDARKKADLKQLKIYEHDRKAQLKGLKSSINPEDKEAMKRYKLQKKALKAELKARRLEIKLRKNARPEQNPEVRAVQAKQFNDRFKNRDFAQQVNNKPMGSLKRDGIFKRVLTEAAIQGAGAAAKTAASRFVEPASKQYGTEFIRYLNHERSAREWHRSYARSQTYNVAASTLGATLDSARSEYNRDLLRRASKRFP